MEDVATDGTSICFLCPRLNAGIVNDVLTAIESSDDIEVAGVIVEGGSRGCGSGSGGKGVGVCLGVIRTELVGESFGKAW